MKPHNVVSLRPKDGTLSNVEMELEALEKELDRIASELSNVLRWNEAGREHAVQCARRSLEVAAQRSHRAKLIARGIQVNKPT